MSVSSCSAGAAAAAGKSYLNDPGTQNYSALSIGSSARSGFRLRTTGDVQENVNTAYTNRATWLLSGGVASNYEVFVTVVSGVIDGGGATGSWLPLSSDQENWIDTEAVETDTAELSVQIRHTVNTADSITFTVNLSATEDSV